VERRRHASEPVDVADVAGLLPLVHEGFGSGAPARSQRQQFRISETHHASLVTGERSRLMRSICVERIDYAVSEAFGDIGVLFTILRSESHFGGDRNGADYFKAPGNIGDRLLPIAATGAGFRCGQITDRLARGARVGFWSDCRYHGQQPEPYGYHCG
jgi:hypothetical protein